MDIRELAIQAVGLVAMAVNTLSYQQKKRSTVIAMQMVGTFLFCVHFGLLGATMGCILNALSAVRAVIFLNKEKLRADGPVWFAGFIAVYIASYILTFTVFGTAATARNLILEVLPLIGMVAITISFRLSDAKAIRKYALISSPCWLVYNIANGSIGAIICEVLSLSSILIGMLRLDRKNQKG